MSRKGKRITDSQGRAVCDLEFEMNGGYDEGSFVVAASYKACWTSAWHLLRYYVTGKICRCPTPVPEDELDHLTESYPELCDEAAFEAMIDRAEAWADAARGH